jgi:hypothetical protein
MRKAAIAVALVALLAPAAGSVGSNLSCAKPAVADGTPIPPLPPPGKHPGLVADGMPLPPPPKKPAMTTPSELA